jgi:hypothetical protein
MKMSATATERPATERAMEALRRSGNPFRNYFARNPDDDVCARYHVPELFASERDLLLAVVEQYRRDPNTPSEVIPILGNKGAGKTHLLHSIKHGSDSHWQMLVTPGVYQRDTEFLEYLLFQIIDTLLGGGRQKGIRPLEYVGEQLVRRCVCQVLADLTPEQKRELFPATGVTRLFRMIGLGGGSVEQRCDAFLESLKQRNGANQFAQPLRRCVIEAGLTPARLFDLVAALIEQRDSHSTAGLMRRAIALGFARAILLEDEGDLANFLTFGFAELEFHVRPTRQDLVLSLLKVLMGIFCELHIPVVVAFDQLEDLLLARRSDDAHRIAEAFFAGIVQVMHQINGLCFLIFAERGLWNRFVPSLDGYIQDRLNNPIHVPGHGTVKTLRLEAPSPELVRRVVEARLRGAIDPGDEVPEIFPFTDEQIFRIARTEPTLRDMLQQFRHLFDHLVYGTEDERVIRPADSRPAKTPTAENRSNRLGNEPPVHVEIPMTGSPPSRLEDPNVSIKSVLIFESEHPPKIPLPDAPIPLDTPPTVPPPVPVVSISLSPTASTNPTTTPRDAASSSSLGELWEHEWRAARRQLEPEGALAGATRELQSALGTFLHVCHEHGVKVGPWRLQHVVPEFAFSEHPTYGVISIAHWACKGGQPWKVGIGLFLGKGGGKPKDLEVKLASWDCEPPVIDHLILLRPDDDLVLSGRSKSLWQDAERKGRHTRLEGMTLDRFAALYAFPRWLTSITESLPEGQPLPNLADIIQEKCEKLLEQVCMPVQG